MTAPIQPIDQLCAEVKKNPRIYNIFPRLVGTFPEMERLLPHCADMGFNMVWIQPFSQSSSKPSRFFGRTGSCYATTGHKTFHPSQSMANYSHSTNGEFIQELNESSVRNFTKSALALGIVPMADLVLNHVAHDHPWVTGANSSIRFKTIATDMDVPGNGECDENGMSIQAFRLRRGMLNPFPNLEAQGSCWDDVAQIDYSDPDCLAVMTEEWKELLRWYVSLGFRAFRVDTASLIPKHLLCHLIQFSRETFRDQIFWLGETMGSPWDTIRERLVGTGLDAVTNSILFWDGQARFMYEEIAMYADIAPSLGSAAIHDSPWPACYLDEEELEEELCKRYALTIFLSEGVIMPYGYEYGTDIPISVFLTTPSDFRQRCNIANFIGEMNQCQRAVSKCRQGSLAKDDSRKALSLGRDSGQLAILRQDGKANSIVIVITCKTVVQPGWEVDILPDLSSGNVIFRADHVVAFNTSSPITLLALSKLPDVVLKFNDPKRVMQFIP